MNPFQKRHSSTDNFHRLLLLLLIGIAAIGNPSPARADLPIYYVDASAGNDSLDGLSPETAWKTIDKINASTFTPGTSILFKRGECWREILEVPNSGTQDNPIAFSAYGSGDKPKITSTEIISGSPEAFDVLRDYIYKNGDLETWSGGLPTDGWGVLAGGGSTLGQETAIVQNGLSSAKLVKDGSNELVLYNNMSYLSGMRYTVRFQARGAVGGEVLGMHQRHFSGGTFYAQPGVDADGFHSQWSTTLAEVERYILTPEWKEYTCKARMDNGSVQLRFLMDTDDATVYIDHIRATPDWTPHATLPEVFGIHWHGQNVLSEFLKDGSQLLDRSVVADPAQLQNLEWTSTTPGPVYYYRDQAGSPRTSGTLLEIATKPYSIHAQNESYLVFDGIEAYGSIYDLVSNRAVLLLENCTNVEVRNCTLYMGRKFGLSAQGSSNILFEQNDVSLIGQWGIDASAGSSQVAIRNNRAHHIGNNKQNFDDGHGIGIASSNDILVENNELYENGSGGDDDYAGGGSMRSAIVLYNVSNGTVRRNDIHDNYRGGITVSANTVTSTGNEVCYNLIYRNGKGDTGGGDHAGIRVNANGGATISNLKILNNVVYSNDLRNANSDHEGGIMFFIYQDATVSDVQIKNNIVFNNIGKYEYSRAIWDGGSLVSADLDNNLYYREGGGDYVYWVGGAQSWNTYHNVNSQEAHSISTDPLFVDSTAGTFELQPLSSAIDAGTDVGLPSDYIGVSVPHGLAPEMGGYEFYSRSEDADSDGATDWEESIAGTDPNDPQSLTRVSLDATDPVQISFDSVPGRLYDLHSRTNLMAGTWEPLGDQLSGSGNPIAITDTNICESIFYRLEVSLP